MSTETQSVHVFGIRHHGPGSARSLVRALVALEPDCVLVEGPADADAVLPLIAHEEMEPPVALLLYAADDPKRAVFYPFALFSPEWQALEFAHARGIPARFMDLPAAHTLAGTDVLPVLDAPPERRDPLGWLAEAAGYGDGERWWEQMVEHRLDGSDLFAAIRDAMAALREAHPDADPREARREAFMRQTIRAELKAGRRRVAVVCGAWHAPALSPLPPARDDAATLKGIPKAKVEATWVPWTYGRLAFESGYGAGVESPGWYHHLWSATDRPAIRWMARVAGLLRDEDLDASPGHVIEAVRLAEALAALRGEPIPGLAELNEATQSLLCFGGDAPMRLVRERLVVGERLGRVPETTPMVPLQQDLRRQQRRLRLTPEASDRLLDLDLRKPNDLERSRLLHRLRLLGIAWGKVERTGTKAGTFHEVWRLRWAPELEVRVIEAALWGNDVEAAATAYARDAAGHAPDLPALTALLDAALLADVADAVDAIMARVQEQSALSSDVGHLMDALPSLANVLRYGNVRRTDAASLGAVVAGLVARIAVGLPVACASLDDDAADAMFERVSKTSGAIALLDDAAQRELWEGALRRLVEQNGVHGLVAGRAARQLLDGGTDAAEVARRFGLALSTSVDPADAAAWVEGFLKGSGLVLLHDDALWGVVDEWLCSLGADAFVQVLPLLRRTFSTFAAAERRNIGERAKRERGSRGASARGDAGVDTARAELVLPLVARILGLGREGGVS